MIKAKEIAKNCENILIVNKSKFVALSFAVCNLQQITDILLWAKQKYADSTHICYAYKLFGGVEKCSDDGEPQGTAGKPILDCIKKCQFDNILIVVVRYFGGIKLGAGGLVRAYSTSASSVLDLSGEKVSYKCEKIRFQLSLSESKFVPAIKRVDGMRMFDVKYDKDISFTFCSIMEQTDGIKAQIESILSRKVCFFKDGECFA